MKCLVNLNGHRLFRTSLGHHYELANGKKGKIDPELWPADQEADLIDAFRIDCQNGNFN